MKFDAYIEERVARMAFELKMVDVFKGWHIRRLRMRMVVLIMAFGWVRRTMNPRQELTPTQYAELIDMDLRPRGITSITARTVNTCDTPGFWHLLEDFAAYNENTQ